MNSSKTTKQDKDSEKQKKVVRKKNIQFPTRIEMDRKQITKCSKQNTLKKFGFHQTIKKE